MDTENDPAVPQQAANHVKEQVKKGDADNMPREVQPSGCIRDVTEGELTAAQKVVKHVKEKAKKGDADDVMRVIDEYCWKWQQDMMNVGDVKGVILDKIFKECNPSVAVELGGYIGYSAVRTARLLKDGGKLYSIEMNSDCAKLAREIVDFAGVGDKVTIINGATETVIPVLKEKYGIQCIDFVFIDHHKSFYKPDLIRLLETGLFRKGTVVLADNMVFPSSPGYLEYVRNHPKFTCETFDSYLEYTERKDSLEKSVYLG